MYIDAEFHLQSTFIVQLRNAMYFVIHEKKGVTWAGIVRRYFHPEEKERDKEIKKVVSDRGFWRVTDSLAISNGGIIAYEGDLILFYELVEGLGSAGSYRLSVEDRSGQEVPPEKMVEIAAYFTDPNGGSVNIEVGVFDPMLSDAQRAENKKVIVHTFLRLWPEIAPGKLLPSLRVFETRVYWSQYA